MESVTTDMKLRRTRRSVENRVCIRDANGCEQMRMKVANEEVSRRNLEPLTCNLRAISVLPLDFTLLCQQHLYTSCPCLLFLPSPRKSRAKKTLLHRDTLLARSRQTKNPNLVELLKVPDIMQSMYMNQVSTSLITDWNIYV